MGLEFVTIAAATAVLDYDIFQGNEYLRRVNYPRVVISVACAGSTAAGDTAFDLKVNGAKLASFTNRAAGWPTNDHKQRVAIPVPANALIEAEITDAALTNPINVEVETVP